MLFISHDLRVVRHVSDEILVIYFGRVVERGHASEIIDAPLHPYTRLLVDAMPAIDRRMATTVAADDGVVSSPPSGGCPFRSRCRLSIARCHTDRPTLRAVDATRTVACHVVGNN
jgi:peptide/nickel transport system ATP-binding protein